MRTLLIAGNWKMYKTHAEAEAFCRQLLTAVASVPAERVEVAVCPPFTALEAAARVINGTSVALGAQNMYPEAEGAFTGEVAPPMLKALGCRYVIIGHSERRQYFNESDEFINRKVLAAYQYDLIPILCVGETLAEREAGVTRQVIERQVRGGLQNLAPEQAANLVIAYEPVWAIGTGRTASAVDAQEVNAFIRQLLADMFGAAVAEKVRIQYGGSVKPENAGELLSMPDIDGALVGGASLKVDSFTGIIKAAVEAR